MYKVPVLMYHSVGNVNKRWIWNSLICPTEIFKNNLIWLKERNYKTITLDELQKYVFLRERIPQNAIVLTFDDGYLDNYVNVFPLLKEFDFCATVFVNPDFVTEEPRNYSTQNKDEYVNGYCNWTELKEMQNTGHFNVESHTMSHTWYPVSDRLIDFRHPGDPYIWATWNDHIKLKPNLQLDNPDLVVLGEPIYEHQKSLIARRVTPPEELKNEMMKFVFANGHNDFFKSATWRETLKRKYNDLVSNRKYNFIQETQKENKKRIEYELGESKNIIEEKLNKTVKYLCWPGGSGSEIGVKIAKSLGYQMSTAARDIPYRVRKKIPNSPIQKTDRILRIGTTTGMRNSKYALYHSFGLKVHSFGKGFLMRGIINLLGSIPSIK